jgi:hypothetical protein
MCCQGVEAVKDAVVEGLFTPVVPQMFHGIELWRIGRQKEELEITGEPELLIAMPVGSVDHHEDVFLAVADSDFIHTNLHALPIHTRQDPRSKDAVSR